MNLSVHSWHCIRLSNHGWGTGSWARVVCLPGERGVNGTARDRTGSHGIARDRRDRTGSAGSAGSHGNCGNCGIARDRRDRTGSAGSAGLYVTHDYSGPGKKNRWFPSLIHCLGGGETAMSQDVPSSTNSERSEPQKLRAKRARQKHGM